MCHGAVYRLYRICCAVVELARGYAVCSGCDGSECHSACRIAADHSGDGACVLFGDMSARNNAGLHQLDAFPRRAAAQPAKSFQIHEGAHSGAYGSVCAVRPAYCYRFYLSGWIA